MQATVIYLLGHFGVGKLTVAKAICEMTGARLFDNHLVNNVIFSLIRVDGKTPLPDKVWDFTFNIRTEALTAIASIAPPDFSYVLTNALNDDALDRRAYQQVIDVAAQRSSVFVPVVLTCAEAENMQRVAAPDRAQNMKHTDPVSALHRRKTSKLLPIDHPNRLDIDTTDLPPEQTAAQIIAHAERLRP